MSTYCVYHVIHVRTPHQHLPKLVIEDVPEGAQVDTGLLERAGFTYGEFGIDWANHILEEVDVKTSPSDLVARIRKGECDRIAYANLVARAESPL